MRTYLFILYILLGSVAPAALAQTAAIPDAAFLTFLKNNFAQTINANNQLIIANAAQVTGTLDCSGKNISSIEGIQYFTSLKKILADNNNLTTIPDISGISTLQNLGLQTNVITALPDLSGLMNLQVLLIYENNLTALPLLQNNPALQQIIASKNQLTTLPDFSKLTNLVKLDVGENAITALPNLSANTKLQELVCWSNQLSTLPSLTNLVLLTRLNAGKNQLTTAPDLSGNPAMSILALDNNFLTTGPDLSGMSGLTSVKLYNNYLSFEDLLPYTGISGFSSNFDISPMKVFAGDTIRVYHTQTADLITHIDSNTPGMSYSWYTNTTLLNTVSTDTFTVATTSGFIEKKYYAILTNPALSSLQIKTDTFTVRFYPCPTASDVSYSATGIDCGKSGSVSITINGTINNNNLYTLTGIHSVTPKVYSTSTIEGLGEQEFSLSVNLDNACYITNAAIVLPYVNCTEAYITPNMDGDSDTYYINGTGTALIYDKSGKVVQKLTLPYDWSGQSLNGTLVPVGYYIIDVNQGKQRVYISVLY